MACREVIHIAIGGSSAHGYATPTSDIDLFVVVQTETEEVYDAVRALGQSFDVEVRTLQWLETFTSHLVGRPHSVLEIGYSGNFLDLRFMVRLLAGRRVVDAQCVFDLLEVAKGRIEFWGRVYLSGAYVNLFQDLTGFLTAQRMLEFRLGLGELILRAIHLGMSQHALFDISSKPAITLFEVFANNDERAALQRLLEISGGEHFDDRHGAAALGLCNMLAAPEIADKLVAQLPHTGFGPEDLVQHCFMGVPGYRVVQDVSHRVVHVYSEEFVSRYTSGVAELLKQLTNDTPGVAKRSDAKLQFKTI